MAGNTMELDDGWSITQYGTPIEDVYVPELYYQLQHECDINAIRSPVVTLATGKLVCMACKRKVPTEVRGLYNLCKWRK